MTSALEWTIWTVVMVTVMTLLGRAFRAQTQRHDSNELKLSKIAVWVGVGTGLPSFGATVGALIFAGPDRWVALIFFAFALLGGYLLFEYLRVRFTVNPDGFDYRTAFKGPGFARWSDVRSAQWSHSMKWLTLRLDDGTVVRVSALVLGFERLAKGLCQQSSLPMDSPTRSVVEAAARGQPPNPWG